MKKKLVLVLTAAFLFTGAYAKGTMPEKQETREEAQQEMQQGAQQEAQQDTEQKPRQKIEYPYHEIGDMKVIRLEDKETKLPASYLIGDKNLIRFELMYGQGFCSMNIVAFLFDTPDGLILMDTGLGEAAEGKVMKNFEKAGYNPDDVKTIFLTHLHTDHFGGTVKDGERVFKNATIYVRDKEFEFWTNRANVKAVPEMLAPTFDAVENFVKLYKDQIKTFKEGEKVIPWLTPIEAAGHTAGHTMYEINYDGERHYILGDIIHCLKVQVKHPEIAIVYDSDKKQAVKTRYKVLKMLSEDEDAKVFGMHLPHPSVIRIFKTKKGVYDYKKVMPEIPKN